MYLILLLHHKENSCEPNLICHKCNEATLCGANDNTLQDDVDTTIESVTESTIAKTNIPLPIIIEAYDSYFSYKHPVRLTSIKKQNTSFSFHSHIPFKCSQESVLPMTEHASCKTTT